MTIKLEQNVTESGPRWFVVVNGLHGQVKEDVTAQIEMEIRGALERHKMDTKDHRELADAREAIQQCVEALMPYVPFQGPIG